MYYTETEFCEDFFSLLTDKFFQKKDGWKLIYQSTQSRRAEWPFKNIGKLLSIQGIKKREDAAYFMRHRIFEAIKVKDGTYTIFSQGFSDSEVNFSIFNLRISIDVTFVFSKISYKDDLERDNGKIVHIKISLGEYQSIRSVFEK